MRPRDQYTLDAELLIGSPAPEVRRWLVEPELMRSWMIGIDEIESVEDTAGRVLTCSISSGPYRAGSRFVGTLDRSTLTHVRRSYRLVASRAGGIEMPEVPEAYIRTVDYQLVPNRGSTQVRCTVTTVIPGLGSAAARAGSNAEQRSLKRSLERLGALVTSGNRSLIARLRDSQHAGQPL